MYNPYQFQIQQSYPQSYQQNYQPQSGIIWVNGISEAEAYPVAPNNAVALWDSQSATIYRKMTDASGKPTLTIFDLVERKPKSTQEEEYARKSDLDALNRAIDSMREEISTLRATKEAQE